jgi:uncharacterized protein YegL
MPNPARRHIAIVLDRSGSMITVRADTEGGLTAFLDAQTEAPGETTVSLYQFDDRYDAVYENRALADVPAYRLVPRGTTALFDAVGRTINTVGEQLAAKPDDERPGEVIVVILTDGHENDSREFTQAQVKSAITHQQDQYGWQFVFLGADQDAFEAGGGMGIRSDSTLSYSGEHTKQSMTNAGRMVARGTESGLYAFTEGERDETS